MAIAIRPDSAMLASASAEADLATFDTGGAPPFGLTFVGNGRVLAGVVGSDLRAWPVR